MADQDDVLAFGVTYDMVAADCACGQLLSLTSHPGDDRTPPHKHVNDYVCIVLNGGFAEEEGGIWRERLAGCYFTHHAGEKHCDRFGRNGAMCLNLHFAEGASGPTVEGACSANAKVLAEKLAFELAVNSREELVLASLAAEIMAELRGRDGPTDNGNWIDRLVEAMSDLPDRRWSLGELARMAGRHPVHVAQSFRAKTGMSLGSFQRVRRLTSLSLALRHGEVPLVQLAAQFGYCDQSHMTSEFRASLGISPGRYRQRYH
jgi:AraC family transcriptional regulator